MKKIFVLIVIFITLLIINSCGKQEKYTLIFNTDSVEEIENVDVLVSNSYQLPILSKEGYEFDGWYLDIDLIDGPYYIVKYDTQIEIELFAKWHEKDYSNAITLNKKIGSLKNNVTIEKEKLIEDLQYKYNNLSEDEKTKITNYQILVDAVYLIEILKTTVNFTDFINDLKESYTISDFVLLQGYYDEYNVIKQEGKDYINEYYLEELNTFLNIYNGLKDQVSGYQDILDMIDNLNGNITLLNTDNFYPIVFSYYLLNNEQQAIVSSKFNNINDIYKSCNERLYNVINLMGKLNSNVNLNSNDDITSLKNIYNSLDNEEKGYIKNINVVESIDKFENTFKAIVIQDDICQTKYVIDEITKEEINDVNKRYLNLSSTYQDMVNNYSILEDALKRVKAYDDEKKNYNVTYVLGKDLQNSKVELAKNFWNSFYNFIYTYGANGVETLESHEVFNTEDFYTMSIDYDGGRNNLYNLGDNFGQYLLQRDLNGIIENQPTTKFYGYAYQNGMYLNDWDFFINFFAFWRIDERYASFNNYGADTFAESWAPTVDLCKFFYFDENTSYVKTERMKDLLNNVTSVCYGELNNNLNIGDTLPILTLRNYDFVGWYDNPEFTGDAYTTLTKDNMTLYAKFVLNEEEYEKDQADLVNVYTYNLLTRVANVSKITIGYLYDMYQELSDQGKSSLDYDQELYEYYFNEWGVGE